MVDGALFDETVGMATPETWTVGELSAQVARVLAGAFPGDIWVSGQIRNISRPRNGHVYFDLAEPTPAGASPRTQLAVTLLAPERGAVNAQIRAAGSNVRMDDGIEVRIGGRLRWWAPRGSVQLRMHAIDPEFTIGRLEADRERLLAALSEEGLLQANARFTVPLVPLRVGIVTSVDSAAHADVMDELRASGFAFEVRTVDARTQGPECGPSVVRALAELGEAGVDVILLVRGGGARTDLAGFDTEVIARAVATAPVPVFTGIGHEIDRSVADEVAHTAHKTPTAAAAALVKAVAGYLDRLDGHAASIAQAARSASATAAARLDRRSARVARVAERTLTRADARLGDLARRTARAGGNCLGRASGDLDASAAQLRSRASRALTVAEDRLDGRTARIRAQDPALLLRRGWSITTVDDPSGALVRDLSALAPGTALVTRVAAGHIRSTVTGVTVTDGTTTDAVVPGGVADAGIEPDPSDSTEPPNDQERP